MWAQLAMAGAQLGSAYLASRSSQKGQEQANEANAAEAQRNRDWQERMSNTAHVREVADLRNAGLNPILSATGGNGASSPLGSTAVHQNTKPNRAELAIATSKMIADTMLSREMAKTEKSKQRNLDANTDNTSGFPLVNKIKNYWNNNAKPWLSSTFPNSFGNKGTTPGWLSKLNAYANAVEASRKSKEKGGKS
ncbi:MAG: DNA pilot protein [Arizlama microvirus]|nr:MAG: DNA pilot protein [Arizlama microvirus]